MTISCSLADGIASVWCCECQYVLVARLAEVLLLVDSYFTVEDLVQHMAKRDSFLRCFRLGHNN
jgi:hypothetical protein